MLRFLSSARITVTCLFLLFILTFWGTIAQVSQGLYEVQERFFSSFFFLAGGFLPFPGAQLVLWVLFINLVCALVEHFQKNRGWAYLGGKIAHAGLLLYFVSAFMIFHFSQTSYVRLKEGQTTNVSVSDNQIYPLPFKLKLEEFKAEFYPSTTIAKNYESLLTIDTGNFKRQVRIIMNKPFSYKDYTFYQASYDTDSQQGRYSIVAVVKNPARFLPYISCLLVFLGMSLHFLTKAFAAKARP